MEEELKKIVPAEIGTIENYTQSNDGAIRLTLVLVHPMQAVAKSVKRALEATIKERTGVDPFIVVKEPSAKTTSKPKVERMEGLRDVARVVAVASGKGGVGKSTVAAELVRALVRRGLRVGLLDADIYGPSQPMIFSVEGYQPTAADAEGKMILPAVTSEGVKLMSIGFFIGASDALVWRGPMATSALRQMIHQTAWGELDVLVVDLPPGTGDVHLTAVAELKIEGAFIVTTPSDLALSDVVRGIEMFRAENINVPILGVINNMAYFQTEDMPGKKYYIFGTSDHLHRLLKEQDLPLVAEIPIGTNTAKYFDAIEF